MLSTAVGVCKSVDMNVISSYTTAVQPTEKRFLTDAELAGRYGVTRAHIHSLRHRGLPSIKLGRARRYDTIACDAWLEQQADR